MCFQPRKRTKKWKTIIRNSVNSDSAESSKIDAKVPKAAELLGTTESDLHLRPMAMEKQPPQIRGKPSAKALIHECIVVDIGAAKLQLILSVRVVSWFPTSQTNGATGTRRVQATVRSVELGFPTNGDGDGLMPKALPAATSSTSRATDGGGGVGWSTMNEVRWGWMKNEGAAGVPGGQVLESSEGRLGASDGDNFLFLLRILWFVPPAAQIHRPPLPLSHRCSHREIVFSLVL